MPVELCIYPLNRSIGIISTVADYPAVKLGCSTKKEAREALAAFCVQNNAHTYKRGSYTYISGVSEEYGDIVLDHDATQFSAVYWTYLIHDL